MQNTLQNVTHSSVSRRELELELSGLIGDKMLTEDHLEWLNLKIEAVKLQLENLTSLEI